MLSQVRPPPILIPFQFHSVLILHHGPCPCPCPWIDHVATPLETGRKGHERISDPGLLHLLKTKSILNSQSPVPTGGKNFLCRSAVLLHCSTESVATLKH